MVMLLRDPHGKLLFSVKAHIISLTSKMLFFMRSLYGLLSKPSTVLGFQRYCYILQRNHYFPHSEVRYDGSGSSQFILGISAYAGQILACLCSIKICRGNSFQRAHMLNCNRAGTPVDTESKLGSDRSSLEAVYKGVANVVVETIDLLICYDEFTPLFTATLVYCDKCLVLSLYVCIPVQTSSTETHVIDINFVR
ncbi:hypothetical protein Tco_1083554 [Tanacetum coccineum]